MSTYAWNKNRYFIERAVIAILLVFLMSGVASATVNTYYWQPSSGAISSSGFTANWGSCGAQPTSYRITTLNSAGFNCQSDRITTSGTGNTVLAIYPTKYNTATQVTGRSGATFYLRERSGVGSVTYRFELGYAKAGAFTSFGYVSQTVPSNYEQLYNIDMSSITGSAPVDSYLALRISTSSSSGEQRAYFGSTNSNSGRFSVDEVAGQSNPTYNVTVRSLPLSASVIAGGNYVYTITVNNTGNTNGNYTLGVTDSDTTNFLNSVLGRTTLSVPAGGSNQTTLTVTAKGTAQNGAVDTTTVTATSVENTNYTNSTQVTTTVQAATPSASVSLAPSAQSAQAGNQVQYTITVQNTGNVADSYILSLNNPNTADFTYALTSTTTGSLTPGAQYVTTMTVTATAGAIPGNSHTQTVRATGNATNTSNTVTTTVAAVGPSKVIVRTNRQIILDDPNSNTIGSSTWGSNYWSGETTTIRAYALALDSKGRAIANHPITFSINGITGSSLTVNTSADGIASYSYQLNDAANNGAKAPGNYTIIANAGTVSSRINFTYSYFGCSRCHNDKGLSGITSRNLNPKSPYITTYNQMHAQTTNKHSGHASTELQGNQCNYCHTSYGTGTSTVNNPSTIGTDVHSTTQKCSNCHNSGTGFFNSAAIIKDCAACHSSYNNKVTSYPSADFWTGGMIKYSSQPMVAHQAAPAIPCILCHSPVHNVSTPDTIKSLNTYTEDNECTSCHASQGKHSTSDPVYCTACHSQDAHVIGVMNKTSPTQPAFVSVGSSNAITASDCVDCHAPGPEATYFAGLTGMTGYGYTTNYITATPVHNNHNGTVACTICHDNSDLHNIKYLTASGAYSTSNASAVTCIDCHGGQNSAVRDTVNSKLGRFPPVVNTPVNHSTDGAGAHWGTYWTDANGACLYCHGDNKHNATRLGNVSVAVGSDIIGGDIGTGTVCSSCHNPGDGNYAATMAVLNPDPVANQPGSINWNASGVDHTSYGATDADCKACHGGVLSASANISEFLHNVDTGKSGGPNCIGCHNAGGIAGPGRLVNVSAMNDTNSLHKDLNRDVATSLSPENKKCWACHGNGNEPGQGHPANYQTPYRCIDCHVSSAGQNTNFTPGSILEVNQHYWNGTSIRTSAATSCYDCHNKSEMMLGQNLDPDGSAGIYGGANGGSNSTSHYGKKRSDYPAQGTNDYCYQCHNNPGTTFPFVDAANKTIANHSTNYASSPNCVDCHATQAGRIHNSTLYKPAFSLPNSTFCLNCHGAGGSAAIKNKEQHNGTLDCTQCHLNDTRSIHSVRYLQQDGVSWDTTKANAVNCTNCHQDTGMTGFSNAPIIPDTLKHSASLSNGTIWGTYWTSEQGSCYYCHGNTKHNNTALGTINSLTLDANNTKSGVLTATTWCADCHYSDAANTYYNGDQWSPAPPTITVDNTGKNGWVNHTSYVASGYKDEKCKSCHALNGAYGTTSLNYSHSLDVGVSGGANCVSCHYVGSSYHNIDTIAANASVHFGMNSNSATGAGLAAINGACWACHDTDGNVTNNPSNQIMGDLYNTPKKCDGCHLASGTYYSQSVAWGGPTVSEHYYNGSRIKAGNSNSDIESCINCHENVSEMVLSNNDPDYGSFAGDGIRLTGGNMSFYHYGKPRSDLRTWDSGSSEDCSYCHQNTSTAFATGMLNSGYSSSIQNHSQTQASPGCYNSTCHNSGWIHNNTLTKPSLNPGSAATFCQNCHTTRQTHNGTLDCSNCHIDQSSNDTIHPIKFIQDTGTFDTSKGQAANCTNCHQGTGVSGFDVAPKVPEPVNHSTSLSAGQKWGNYWDNNSQITACYYCHQNEIHENNTDLLGNVSVIKGSNIFNNPDLANSTWCANCHYAGAQDYKGNLLAVSPPEITDSSLVASDGTLFFNHSGLSNFNDSNCKGCHGFAISGYSETSLNLSHSVSEGGGENCIECHGTNYIGATPSVTSTFVNISAFDESIHQNINATPPATLNNIDCWSCHYNKDMNRQNVKKCGDCHRKPSQWHGNAAITTNLSELW